MTSQALVPYAPSAAVVRAWAARHYPPLALEAHAEAMARRARMMTVLREAPPIAAPSPAQSRSEAAERVARHARIKAWPDAPPATFADGYAMAHAILDEATPRRHRPILKPAEIIKAEVCREWGITLAEMLSGGRWKKIVVPRHVAMWIHKAVRPQDSTQTIGRSFAHPVDGRPRDHATVMNAIWVIERIAAGPAFAARVERVRLRIAIALVEAEARRMGGWREARAG